MARKGKRDPVQPPADPPAEKPAAPRKRAARKPAARGPAAAPAEPAPGKRSPKKGSPEAAEAAIEKDRKRELGRLEAMKATEIASAFGVNRRTVYEWFADGCPRSLVEAAAWVIQNRNGQKLGRRNAPLAALLSGAALDPDAEAQVSLQRQMHAEKLRGKQIDNEQAALELAEKRQDLVSRKRVKRDVATIFVRIKERLLVAPDRFEPRFPADVRIECKQDFQDFCRLLLFELRTMLVGGEDVESLILAAADEIRGERRAQAEAIAATGDQFSVTGSTHGDGG